MNSTFTCKNFVVCHLEEELLWSICRYEFQCLQMPYVLATKNPNMQQNHRLHKKWRKRRVLCTPPPFDKKGCLRLNRWISKKSLTLIPTVVRSILLRLLLMGPLRANPGGPPASVAWTPLTQGSPYQINKFEKKLFWDPPDFIYRFRIFKGFFQGWTADTATQPTLGHILSFFFEKSIKTFQIHSKSKNNQMFS